MNELSSWKVFRMNDCDLVAAKSEEEAKDFYQEFVDREQVEMDFEGEADLIKTKIRVFTNDLSDADKERLVSIMHELGEDVLKNKSFRCQLSIWLEIELLAGQDKPFIIASTEY